MARDSGRRSETASEVHAHSRAHRNPSGEAGTRNDTDNPVPAAHSEEAYYEKRGKLHLPWDPRVQQSGKDSGDNQALQQVRRPNTRPGKGDGDALPPLSISAVLREVQKAAKKLPLHCSMNTRSTYSDGLDVVGLLNVVEALI